MGREQRLYSDQVHASSNPELHKALTKSAPTFQLHKTAITNPDGEGTVYTIDQTTAPGSMTHRPLLTIKREEKDFATIRFKTLNTGIEVNLHNLKLDLKEANVGGQFKYHFAPTCDEHARWTWAESSHGQLVLIDEKVNELKIATVSKEGVLQFADEYDAKWVDDVMVTAVAVWYKSLGWDVGDSKMGERIESLRTSIS